MLPNNVYYTVKPFIPGPVRLALRQWVAKRKWPQVQSHWPILHGSEKAPVEWTGWPNNKKFAFILTHDVEGELGRKKCVRLMELEQQEGFVSSFNFIPQGNYHSDDAFREQFVRNGFEVGVHDLHHDGKLYQDRDQFTRKAREINRYIQEWRAEGFRSGSMHHNLEWLHAVDAKYDASTFDTDPFEPQPDGVGTIFPFYVPHANSGGYVELPYTLPQDSTLFLLLKEPTPRIWFEKLEFVARHGGMAMVIVHPDYICFNDEKPSAFTYPVEHYLELLRHVKSMYGGTYWNVCPKDVARHYRQMRNGALLQP